MGWADIKAKQEWLNKQTGRVSRVETSPTEMLDYVRLLHSSGRRTLIKPGL